MKLINTQHLEKALEVCVVSQGLVFGRGPKTPSTGAGNFFFFFTELCKIELEK